MEQTFSLLIIFFIALVMTTLNQLLRNCRRRHRLPPGPLPLPIIGNLHQLSRLPPHQFRKLSRTYGPIMLLHLGNVPTIVISTPRAAELILKTHDVVFSSRPTIGVLRYISEWEKTMLLSPSNGYWRQMRRLCAHELLTETKVREFGKVRREVVVKMVQSLRKKEKDDGVNIVDMSRVLANVMEELVCRIVIRGDDGKRDGFELAEVIDQISKLVGAFNIGDYIPIFRPFDLQGLRRRAKEVNKALHNILEAIVTSHEQNAPSRGDENFIDMLLALMNKPVNKMTNDETSDYFIDRSSIKAIVLDMIAGGIGSTSTTLDWALAEIMRNPGVLKRLQDELDEVVGKKRMVEESDMPKLEYLEMVVKEALRLHPMSPMLVPHESYEDIVVDGYLVPKGTRVIINVWAIGRDPDTWSTDAEEFRPERFEGLKVDYRGHNFELLPFGSGRRSCPGMNLGIAMVKLSLAQLVHCFEWEMPKGMSPNEIDMSEEFGISMPRAKHLYLIPRYRLLV